MDLSQVELMYRAEGNANLVLVLREYKKVLRLPKTTLDSSKIELIVDPQLHVGYIAFIKKIFTSNCYVPEIVTINESQRARINEFVAPFRPTERLDKEFNGQFGLLFPDATFLPDNFIHEQDENSSTNTFCVEIKPKQGWRPTDLPNVISNKALSMCRYCCMQYLKMKKGKISTLSKYCPMDLFSGNCHDMRKTLYALLESPQNNLRIFKNGILVYGSKQQTMTIDEIVQEVTDGNLIDFQNLVLTCLLKDFGSGKNVIVNGTNRNGYRRTSCNNESNLPYNCVLRKVLELQNLAKDNFKVVMKDEEYSNERTYSYLEGLVRKRHHPIDFSDLTPKEKYILGATCMDCSIMISFKKIDLLDNFCLSSTQNIIQIGHQYFIAKVTVVDLDPKPDQHIHKYIRQTKEAYSAATEYYLN